MYNFPSFGNDFRVKPNYGGYVGGPKLLDPTTPAQPTYPQPPAKRPNNPFQMNPGGGYSMRHPSHTSPDIPQGYEQYRFDPWNRKNYRGYRKIFFNGQYYMLPPGVDPPPGYQEPNYQVRLY